MSNRSKKPDTSLTVNSSSEAKSRLNRSFNAFRSLAKLSAEFAFGPSDQDQLLSIFRAQFMRGVTPLYGSQFRTSARCPHNSGSETRCGAGLVGCPLSLPVAAYPHTDRVARRELHRSH